MIRRVPAVLLLALSTLTVGASGQRIVDWPMRVAAGAEATVPGAAAVFWNPASLRRDSLRVDALVIDLRAPQDVAVNSVAAAVAYTSNRTVFGLGYRHAGIDEIPFTEGPPTDNGNSELSVGEDELILAAAQTVSSVMTVGATARYLRANYAGAKEDGVTVGAGVALRTGLPLDPRLSAYFLSESDQLNWALGAEFSVPHILGPDFGIKASYGIRTSDAEPGTMHRIGTSIDFRDRAQVGAAMVREPNGGGVIWQPALAASLRLNRYTVGVVREQLSNGFGATYTLRLQFGLER